MDDHLNNPYQASVHEEVSPTLPPELESQIPKVFGIIHIVYAVLGALMGIFGIVSSLFFTKSKMFSTLADGGDEEVAEQLEQMQGFLEETSHISLIDGGLKLVLAALLLFAGIQLLRRKKIGMKLSKVWAVLRIVVAIPMTYLGTQASIKMQEELLKTQDNPFAGSGMSGLNLVGAVVGVLVVVAYPIVTLIFVRGQKVSDSLK